MDAEPAITAATATVDFKLLALAVFIGALMVAIFSGGPLRKMTIYGIMHSILKPLCLLVGVLYIAWTLLYLVAWCFRLLFLLARIVRRNVPREGLADRLDTWLKEFEGKLDNGNDSSNPTTETEAASQSKSNESISGHEHST
ncbi:uncharacterized protein [Pyrus communis]|uniref:uncharacterized protein n=1 Tax=Pyrus communis TaxID=23211 RepID=UPI0035C05024